MDGADTEELRSLVLHTLETNGELAKIRAQLRASVYKAIDGEPQCTTGAAGGSKLTESPVGRLLAEIVAEFFEFYGLQHSLSVFLPESHLGRERRSRAEVALDAGLSRVVSDESILEQLVGVATGVDLRKGGLSSASSTTASSPPPPLLSASGAARPASAGMHGQASTMGVHHGGPLRKEHQDPQESSGAAAADVELGADSDVREAGIGNMLPSREAPESGLERSRAPSGRLPVMSLAAAADGASPRASPRGGAPSKAVHVDAFPEVIDTGEMSQESIGEVREDMLRLQQINRQIARLKGGDRSPKAAAVSTPVVDEEATEKVEERAESEKSERSSSSRASSRQARSLPRSASASSVAESLPAGSSHEPSGEVARGTLQSTSRALSPARSSASPLASSQASAASRAESLPTSPVASVASPASLASDASVSMQKELTSLPSRHDELPLAGDDCEESFSVDGSGGSGSIHLSDERTADSVLVGSVEEHVQTSSPIASVEMPDEESDLQSSTDRV